MTNRIRIALVAATIGILSVFAFAQKAAAPTLEIEADPVPAIATPEIPEKREISHRQFVWIHALEWCESRGEISAVNEADRDGTPSFYAFQFKPGTFRFYGERYGVIPKGLSDADLMERLKDRDAQFAIVSEMVLHYDEIEWLKQFPDCIRIKIGMPPRS